MIHSFQYQNLEVSIPDRNSSISCQIISDNKKLKDITSVEESGSYEMQAGSGERSGSYIAFAQPSVTLEAHVLAEYGMVANGSYPGWSILAHTEYRALRDGGRLKSAQIATRLTSSRPS